MSQLFSFPLCSIFFHFFSSNRSFFKYLVTGEYPPLVDGVSLVYRKVDGEPDHDDELKNGSNRRSAKNKKA